MPLRLWFGDSSSSISVVAAVLQLWLLLLFHILWQLNPPPDVVSVFLINTCKYILLLYCCFYWIVLSACGTALFSVCGRRKLLLLSLFSAVWAVIESFLCRLRLDGNLTHHSGFRVAGPRVSPRWENFQVYIKIKPFSHLNCWTDGWKPVSKESTRSAAVYRVHRQVSVKLQHQQLSKPQGKRKIKDVSDEWQEEIPAWIKMKLEFYELQSLSWLFCELCSTNWDVCLQ